MLSAPQPQSVKVLSGKGLKFGELSYVSSAEGTSIPVLGEIVDGLPQSRRSGKGVWFQLATENVPDSPEGYVLEISRKRGNKEKITKAKEEAKHYERIASGIRLAEQNALRNRYTLEVVYSETRFMQQPEGFIADMNHHNHLSSKTENSDWLYLYEIPMIKKVLQLAGR